LVIADRPSFGLIPKIFDLDKSVEVYVLSKDDRGFDR